MKNEISEKQENSFGIYAVVVLIFIALAWLWTTTGPLNPKNGHKEEVVDSLTMQNRILLPEGIVLPIQWGSIGEQMMAFGVIDETKLVALYKDRGGLSADMKKLLYSSNVKEIRMTLENSGELLNLLWGFGLGNKNSILETGPMVDPGYGGAGGFASTGGWGLTVGTAMDHYSKHAFIVLTPEQQVLVEKVSKNIYRPCCGNSTYFPDCNHGMAMLGLLELMAANGVGEEEMYRVALQVNAYWFPDTYLTIAKYLDSKGIDWAQADPKELLGSEYSSGSGYQRVRALVEPIKQQGGGGCGL